MLYLKKIFILFTFLSFLCSCGFHRVPKDQWFSTFAASVAFSVSSQITVHETSHLLIAVGLGWDVTGFYPYPHAINDKLYFGRTTFDSNTTGPGSSILFNTAPLLIDTTIFVLSDISLSFFSIEERSPVNAFILAIGMLAPLVDATTNYFLGSDQRKSRLMLHNQQWTLNVVGAILILVGTWRIVHHLRRNFDGKSY